MYSLITQNNTPNSPVIEFGTNSGSFQIVLNDASQYQNILDLTSVPFDIIGSIIGKVSIPLTDKTLVEKAMTALLYHGLTDLSTVNNTLRSIFPGYAGVTPVSVAATPVSVYSPGLLKKTATTKEVIDFFNKHLEGKLGVMSLSSYPLDRDGGLNPALKIFSGTNQNKIENDRWEVFVILRNELGKVELRSGVKSETWDYDDLRVTEQFNLSLFSNSVASDIKQRLLNYRGGHPSLALDIKQLDKGVFQTLPVFAGGWLIRNDLSFQKRLQVYWSSGRYNRDLSVEAIHLMQLCAAFNLMTEYGKDFNVEFYSFESITMEKFITKSVSGSKAYDWKFVLEEMHDQIESVVDAKPTVTVMKK
jgi:hypothetical protein